MIIYTAEVNQVGMIEETREPVYQAWIYAGANKTIVEWKGCRRLEYGLALQESRIKLAEYLREEENEEDD